MSIYKLYFLSFLALFIAGCSSDLFLVHNGNMPSPDKVSQLRRGQSQEEVRNLLGSPSSVNPLDENTWIYMSSTLKKVAFFKPEEIDREVLSITFNADGQVSGISHFDKESGEMVAIDETETPTMSDDVGFFKKYFGGVGAYMPIAPTETNTGL